MIYSGNNHISVPKTANLLIEDVLQSDPHKMTDKEITQSALLLRYEADRLMGVMGHKDLTPANDSDEMQDLYEKMTLRHGCGFAQWIIDQINGQAAIART